MRRRQGLLPVVLAVLAVLGSAASQCAGRSARGKAMDLEITLVLERNELVVGEDTPLTVVYRNTSGNPVLLPDPKKKAWAQIRVRDLERRTEKSFSPEDVARRGADSFLPPIPPVPNTVEPGKELKDQATLLKRVEIPLAGKYELTALFGSNGTSAESKPVTLNVQPLKLRSVDFAGAHSGSSPYRYSVWSHNKGVSSALLFGCVIFNEKGEALTTVSRTLAEVDHSARPVISVSANKLPFESHWVAWLAANNLYAIYTTQGRVVLKTPARNADIAHATLIGPILNDLVGNDGSRPGKGEAVLWAPGIGRQTVAIRILQPDGTLGNGPSFETDPGELKWGRTSLLSNSERRLLVVVDRKGSTSLEWVRWKDNPGARGRLQQAVRWSGTAVASGMSLSDDDELAGATVLASIPKPPQKKTYTLHPWRLEGAGTAREEPVVTIKAEGLEFDRGFVETSRSGNVAVFLHTPDGRWFVTNGSGECKLLPKTLEQFGEPVGAFWLTEAEPLVIMAGAQTGVTYQKLGLR